MAQAVRDNNFITSMIVASSADGATPTLIYGDPTTHRMLVDALISGGGSTGSAVPATAVYQGLIATTSLPTAATAGNMVGAQGDKYGRTVVITNGIRDIVGSQTTTIAASTSETTVGTAVASTFLDLTSVMISNTSATAARVDFRDTTGGSVIFSIYAPAGDIRGAIFNTPQPQTSVNTNWTAQSSASITDLRIFLQFIKNK